MLALSHFHQLLSPDTEEELDYMSQSILYATQLVGTSCMHMGKLIGKQCNGFLGTSGDNRFQPVYDSGGNTYVTGYVDSDCAGHLDRRRSLTGYVFTLGECTISWKVTLQSTVALSTTKAEYMAMTEFKHCLDLVGVREK
ncbi:secreted RxLR effector protein 161-like protein [Tanacetum coccineum]